MNSSNKSLIKPDKFSKLNDSLANIQVIGNDIKITGIRPVYSRDRMFRQIKKKKKKKANY